MILDIRAYSSRIYFISSQSATVLTNQINNDENTIRKIKKKRVKLDEKTGEILSDDEIDDVSDNENIISNIEFQPVEPTKRTKILNEITGEFHEVEEIDESNNIELSIIKKHGKMFENRTQTISLYV